MLRARSLFSLTALVGFTLASVSAQSQIKFSTPSVVDPIHTAGEPDIGIDPQGRVFVSGPTGTGTQRSVWFGSVDNGQTFRAITPGVPPSGITSFVDPPGGGDTDIAFDRAGKQYFVDLYALTCLRTAVTKNGGGSVAQSVYPAGCAGVPGADRQWLALWDPPNPTSVQSAYRGPFPQIYLEYNNLVAGGQWDMSNLATDPDPNGPGLNFSPATAGTADTSCSNPLLMPYAPFGADGHPAIDQLTGKVFQANTSDNGNGTANLLLNIGTPDAQGILTFLDVPTAAAPCSNPGNLITVATNIPNVSSEAANFVVTAMDTGRNLHIAWVGRSNSNPALRQVWVSTASAASGWTKWSPPVQVSSAPSAVAVFPWIVAGSAGRDDVVWYGSDRVANPSTDSGQAWNVFMAQVVWPVDASGNVTGALPGVSQVQVTPHPMHYNDICLAGTDCIQSQGNRNLADFFDVAIDATGAAMIVYNDTSNGLVQSGFTPDNAQLIDHAGAPVITVARQSAGPGLLGSLVSGTSNAPVSGMTDTAGDALWPVIGGANVPGYDIVGNSITLSGSTLTVTTKVVDLSNPAGSAIAVPGTNFMQYVTRWQMGNTVYYAAMENTAANAPVFYAGAAKSVDLCSVSACFPHVITYPEPALGGTTESGSVSCPASPSASNPCTITIKVNAVDVGGPTSSSLLEEVGSYALASTSQSGALTNAEAAADNVPLEVDGLCCYNTVPPPPQVCRSSSGSGSVPGKSGGNASFGMHHDNCGLKPDSASFGDTGVNFQASSFSSATYDDTLHSMTLVGTGTDNGLPVTFTIVAVDSSLVSPGSFSITLSDGYTNTAALTSGSITLQ